MKSGQPRPGSHLGIFEESEPRLAELERAQTEALRLGTGVEDLRDRPRPLQRLHRNKRRTTR